MAIRRLTALALAAGFLVAGCDEDNAADRALESASIKLASLAPRGQRAPIASLQEKTFKDVVSSLQSVASGGTKSQAAAAAILISQAQAGLAEIPASRSAALERECIHLGTTIRATLSQWHTFTAMAAGAAKFDPAKDLAALDANEREIDSQIASENSRKTKIEAEVARLGQAAAAKADQARRRQAEAGQIKQRVPNESATAGEQLLIQASAISREADQLEVQAARFEAEAAKVAPQIDEVKLSLERLTRQKALVGSARDDLRKRDQAAKAQAAEARASAKKAADDLAAQVDQLVTLRTKDLAASNDEEIAALEASSASARKALSQDRTSAQLAVGAAQQSLGDVYWSRGRGLETHAALLTSLAAAGVPNADALKAQAAKAEEDAKTAYAATVEAYKAAHEAYQAAGAKGDAEARMRRVSESLNKAVRAASGGQADLGLSEAPPPEEAAAPDAAPAAAEIAADLTTPQGVFQYLIEASKSGDYSRFGDAFIFNTEIEKKSFVSLLSLAPKMEKLDAAMKAKFGKGMDGMAGAGANAGIDPADFKDLKASDIPITVSGDTAEATIQGEQIALRQKDGKWGIDLRSMGGDPQQVAMVGLMVPALSRAVDEMTADVNAGKFSSFEQAMQAFMTKMAGAAQGGLPRPGGG